MKNSNRLFIDVHVLQTLPPSCVNRDDTGSPKTAVYGGVTRSRVSSQSWKRAIRTMFKDVFPRDQLGVRTKKIVGMVADEIQRLDSSANAEEMAEMILKTAGLKVKSVEKGTDALFFLGIAQAKALAELAVRNPETITQNPSATTKKTVEEALKLMPGIDIALFGRMVADNASLNTDACAQVAHSISTHKVNNEYDYFTAVDDYSSEGNAGAGHIGTIEYNSSTLYRYGTVAVHELFDKVGESTTDAVREFIRVFVSSMPTGKLNSFANHTLPEALLVTLRSDQPVNLVGAFERPIPAGEEGYMSASAARLVSHTKRLYQDFAEEPELSLVTGQYLSELGEIHPLNELLLVVEERINKFIENSEVLR